EARPDGVRGGAEDEREPAHPEALVDQRNGARGEDEDSKAGGERRRGQRVGSRAVRCMPGLFAAITHNKQSGASLPRRSEKNQGADSDAPPLVITKNGRPSVVPSG